MIPAQRAASTEDFIERSDGLPAQPGQEFDGGLLDQRVFGVTFAHLLFVKYPSNKPSPCRRLWGNVPTSPPPTKWALAVRVQLGTVKGLNSCSFPVSQIDISCKSK